MVSTFVFSTLLLFNSLFFYLVVGQPPSEVPFQATSHSSLSNISVPLNPAAIPLNGTLNPTANSSVAAPPTTNCSCSLKPVTLISCALVVIEDAPKGVARDLCCEGLQGLSQDQVYDCLCYAFSSNILRAPAINITVPVATRIVSLACAFLNPETSSQRATSESFDGSE